ncbi:MAG: MFS transporter [Tenericutes bacterium HGW-Tenericutes-1]|jgi:MFS family permease|nr:MAG: MFS transporter [Tenericutes bacterium HGW-Tenericutes-1]
MKKLFNNPNDTIKKRAFLFIVLLGIISFFSDFTHEGARSIYGQYLSLIGVSAFLVSTTAGLGEFIGQALRILTGWIADKTGRYWFMMILGYSVNLLAIPLLGLVNQSIWQIAIILILLERVGKAIRAPAKSALTSFTAPHLGAGKAFAINEALDQAGAFLGPLVVFFIISNQSSDLLLRYQISFGILGIFAIVTIFLLFFAKSKYPTPQGFEEKSKGPQKFVGDKKFVIYMLAISFIALGFVDYPVIAYHMGQINTIDVLYIPLIYSFAMGIDAIAALIFGALFDKIGISSLMISVAISILITPFIFITNFTWALLIGVVLWGIGMGAQESILKAVVAKLVPKEKRATGYGIFSSVFGFAWFLGSLLIGVLYTVNIQGIVIFTVAMQVIAFILLYYLVLLGNKDKKRDIKAS